MEKVAKQCYMKYCIYQAACIREISVLLTCKSKQVYCIQLKLRLMAYNLVTFVCTANNYSYFLICNYFKCISWLYTCLISANGLNWWSNHCSCEDLHYFGTTQAMCYDNSYCYATLKAYHLLNINYELWNGTCVAPGVTCHWQNCKHNFWTLVCNLNVDISLDVCPDKYNKNFNVFYNNLVYKIVTLSICQLQYIVYHIWRS